MRGRTPSARAGAACLAALAGALSEPSRNLRAGSWVCLACGNINFPGRTTCNRSVCGAPLPGGAEAPSATLPRPFREASPLGMPRSEVDGGDPGGPSPFSQPNAAAAAAAAADAAFAAAVAPKPSQPQPQPAAAAGGGATWTFKGMVFSGQQAEPPEEALSPTSSVRRCNRFFFALQVLPSEATPIGAKGAPKAPNEPRARTNLARISHGSHTRPARRPQGPKNPAIAPAPPPAKPALALLPIDDAEKRARVDRAARFASTAAERALQELHYTPLTHPTTLHYTPLH